MSQVDVQEGHRDQSSEPWIISFRDTSQYSKGGPSACGLAAVNAARDILTVLSSADIEHNPLEYLEKEETATAIMSICSYWESNEHLDVQDILNLPFFSCHLETKRVEDNQCGFENFTKLTESLVSDGAVAAVVTRSPEIVAVINAPRTPFGNVTIIFDSHPRPEHPLGAAFLMYQSPKDAAAYLDKLFAVDPAIMRDLSWQTQMLSRYSAHVISLKYSTEEETITSVYEANIKLLNYSENIKEAVSREAATQAELSTLRDTLKRQREAREKACLEEEEAVRKLERLRKELESARQFVLSLVNPGTENGLPSSGYTGSHNDRKSRKGDELVADKKGKAHQQSSQSSVHASSGLGWGIPGLSGRKSSASQYYGYHKPSRKREEGTTTSRQDRNESKPPPKAHTHNIVEQNVSLNSHLQELTDDERRSYELARQLQMREEQDWLQHEELVRATAHDKGFNCGVCFEDYSEGNIARVDGCGHGTCRECMRYHIGAQLEQRRWPIICAICVSKPDQAGELGVISRDLAEMVGSNEEMLRAWTQIEIERVAIKVECPTCHKAYYVDVMDFNETEMLWCQELDCDAYWCKKCNQLAERGFRHTCDGEAEMERYLEADKTIKKCPGCQALVQRKEGCYHMTCKVPHCNTHFCDRCGKKIIKSFKKAEIDDAVRNHFNGNCQLFDVPDED